MTEKKQERISIFIDGSNLYHSLKVLKGVKIDFEKLIKAWGFHYFRINNDKELYKLKEKLKMVFVSGVFSYSHCLVFPVNLFV